MDFEYFNDLLANLSLEDKAKLAEFIQTVEEIECYTNTSKLSDNYPHLILREKYFILIQNIIEANYELLIKFTFRLLQNFCKSEIDCSACTSKEKSQFILNILRYIEHTHISQELIKLEVFKFLLNNHESISPFLTTKILHSLIQIALNDYDSSNKLIQGSSRALVIKYTAVVCNQINSLEGSTPENELVLSEFDTYLVDYFQFLLGIFNEDFRPFELRVLVLECIELLLNNLLVESKADAYNLIDNQAFITFTWQVFCPSILFQFSEYGISAKMNAVPAQKMPFKQIYTILIQLTGLVASSESIFNVFEAIYQRILLYPPEQDRNLLLKLFKSYVNKKFILNITCSRRDAGTSFNDFTLVNLIVGFYRNCYEKAIKSPEDKILKFLSCECISAFVELINKIYEEGLTVENQNQQITLYKLAKPSLTDNTEACSQEKTRGKQFFYMLIDWLDTGLDIESESECFNLDLEIKRVCLRMIEKNAVVSGVDANVYYATVSFCLTTLFGELDILASYEDRLDYFKIRVISYDTALASTDPITSNKLQALNHWLNEVYKNLCDYKSSHPAPKITKNSTFSQHLTFLQHQTTCHLFNQALINSPKLILNQIPVTDSQTITLTKSLLQCSWTYLIDVLTGFILHTNINHLEEILFFNHKSTIDLNNATITDISFNLVAFKSCLDSLHIIVRIASQLKSMDKELCQVISIMTGDCFKPSIKSISLNELICFDFLLHSSTRIVCDLFSHQKSNTFKSSDNNYAEIWKSLTEIYFAVNNLQANIDRDSDDTNFTEQPTQEQTTAATIRKLKSVYFNRDELFFFGRDETENFETSSKLMGTIRTKGLVHSKSLDDELNLVMFAKIKYQQETIIKSLFPFTNSGNKLVTQEFNCDGDHKAPEYYLHLSKRCLVDGMANRINCYMNDEMFNRLDSFIVDGGNEQLLDSFQFIWSFVCQCCQFSKWSILQGNSISQRSLNNLVVDKLQDIVLNLMTKLTGPKDPQKNVHLQSLTTSDQSSFYPYSIYSIFITELWLRVLVDYLLAVLKRTKIFRKNKKQRTTNSSEKSHSNIDLTLCNKLLSMIQKCFEAYSTSSGKNNSRIASSNQASRQKEPIIQQIKLSYPDTRSFLSNFISTDGDTEIDSDISSKLLINSITSILLEESQEGHDELSQLDNSFVLSTIFLLPFRQLMQSRRLDTHLQEAVMASLRVLIECGSIQSYNGWECVFACLSSISLNTKLFQKENFKISNFKFKSLDFNIELSKLLVESVDSKTKNKSSLSKLPVDSSNQQISIQNFDSLTSSSTSENDSSSSDSDSSESSLTAANVKFRPSLRFNTCHLRLHSLIEIFNIYLRFSYNSTPLLSNGAFQFIKCITNYLQYSNRIEPYNPDEYVSFFVAEQNDKAPKTPDSINSQPETFITAYECSLEEFHFQITSNYEHLRELSSSKNSPSFVRPFLNCLEKLFDIVITRVNFNPLDNIADKHNKCGKYLLKQPDFVVDFVIGIIKPNKHLNVSDAFKFKTDLSIIQIEMSADFANLSDHLSAYLANSDSSNTFKLLVYLIHSLTTRTFLSHDALNCVQLTLQIDTFIAQLIINKHFILVSYLLIDVLFKNLLIQIDHLESRLTNPTPALRLINPALADNIFFLSSFINNRIESCLNLVVHLLKTIAETTVKNPLQLPIYTPLLTCLISRVIYTITSSVLRKLSKFNSIIKLNFLSSLSSILKELRLINRPDLIDQISTAIKTLHSISLLSFNEIISHCNEAASNSYTNLGVATENCTTAWEFFSVKSTFQLARNVLFKNESAHNIEGSECFSEMTNEDKNVFRNFTLQFNNFDQVFSDLPSVSINLTCFIFALKFHLCLVDVMNGMTDFNEELECTWRVGLKIDKLLAFKVLLTKIFGLNHEVSVANFTNMCRMTCVGLYRSERLSLRFMESMADEYFKLYESCHSEKQDLNLMLKNLLPGVGFKFVESQNSWSKSSDVNTDENEMDYKVRDARTRCRAWTKMVYRVVVPGIVWVLKEGEKRLVEGLVKVLTVLLSLDVQEVEVCDEVRKAAVNGLKQAIEKLDK